MALIITCAKPCTVTVHADTVRVRDPEELYGSSMPVTETVEEIEKERFGNKDSPSRD